MRGLAILTAAALFAAPVCAQERPDEDPAITAVKSFMKAFDAQDAEAMSAHIVDGATIAVIEEREGKDRARILPLSALVTSIAANPADLAEPVWTIAVMSKAPVSMVHAKYEFLIDGERSHCGFNIYNLMRIDGEWKIASITYSHVEDDCGEGEGE
jgi:hypothetical protein